MIQGKNRRLANVKTRRETGLDYVMFNLDLNTPFGKKQLKEMKHQLLKTLLMMEEKQ